MNTPLDVERRMSYSRAVAYTVILMSVALVFMSIGIALTRTSAFSHGFFIPITAGIVWSIVFLFLSLGCTVTIHYHHCRNYFDRREQRLLAEVEAHSEMSTDDEESIGASGDETQRVDRKEERSVEKKNGDESPRPSKCAKKTP